LRGGSRAHWGQDRQTRIAPGHRIGARLLNQRLSNRSAGLRNTTRSRSGTLLPMADESGAPGLCRPCSQTAFFSLEPAPAPPWPPPPFSFVSSGPPAARNRVATRRPTRLVSIMACSWNTRILPSAALLSTFCEKHRLFWRPYFARSGAYKDRERKSQSGVDPPGASAYISAQQVQSIRQEPAGRRSDAE
jgi:hypothetical protein